MKYTRIYTSLAIFLLQFVATHINAGTSADSLAKSKAIFYTAKQEITNMLEGKIPLNYERAEFIIENAYRDNQENYRHFQLEISKHVEKIRNLASVNNDEKTQNYKSTFLESEQQKREKYNKALLNFAIFHYITDTTISVYRDNFVSYTSYHLPYKYSNEDPFGTINWNNTQVLNLFDIKENKGNCYALVSLFKIFSERLKTGAIICTAPGHIYIRHDDSKGVAHNVELATRSFPGAGTISTITYTTDEALMSNIALRELNLKQSIALCLVYLAKGYEQKYKIKEDDFMLQCAETALKHDSLNLNAMLLKADILEERVIMKKKTLAQLQTNYQFKEYEKLISQLYILGYREMPLEMKNRLISAMKKDGKQFLVKDHTPKAFTTIDAKNTRYATLSSGRLEEMHENKSLEQYNRTIFDTKRKKISKFATEKPLYNNYNFDPVVFAWQVDPMTSKLPSWSPYAAFNNNPILYIDQDGQYPFTFYIRSYESSGFFGFPFTSLGDARSASTSSTASARIHFKMNIETDGNKLDKYRAWSSPSIQINYPIAPIINPKVGEAKPDYSASQNGKGGYNFNASAEEPIMAKLPIVGGLTPAINIKGSMNITEKDGILNINGQVRGDGFPDAETFIKDNSGQSIMLGTYNHGSLGSPVWSLPGNGDQQMINVNVQVKLTEDGNFDKAWSIDGKGNRTPLNIIIPEKKKEN